MRTAVARSIGAVVVCFGLVASTGDVAHASSTIVTITQLPIPVTVKKHHRASICATVVLKVGTGTPVGEVTITITRNAGPYSASASFAYAGGPVCLRTKKLHGTGGYAVGAFYTARPGTVFLDSVQLTGFDVVQPPR